jgi:membrane protein
MGRYKKVGEYLWGRFSLLNEKKYTTIAGTLVFFFLMSLVPMLFWATLLLGKLHVEISATISLPGTETVVQLLEYLQEEAQNATSGASVFLLVTSLYSATNLFYQMRKSGEIIYGVPYIGKGLKTRLSALVILFLLLALIAVAAIAFTILSFFLAKIANSFWEVAAKYSLLVLLAFLLVVFLNLYICPYKVSPKYFLVGSLLTVGAWTVAIFGFAIYLRIGNVGRLYGTLSAVIVFLLWLYMMTVCFVSGVIFNSERVLSLTKKKRARW